MIVITNVGEGVETHLFCDANKESTERRVGKKGRFLIKGVAGRGGNRKGKARHASTQAVSVVGAKQEPQRSRHVRCSTSGSSS